MRKVLPFIAVAPLFYSLSASDFKFDYSHTWYVQPLKYSTVSVGYSPDLMTLSSKLKNNLALQYVRDRCQNIFIGENLDELREKYNASQDSLLANIFGLHKEFSLRDKSISPAQRINALLENSVQMHNALRQRPVAMSQDPNRKKDWMKWKHDFRSLLDKEFDALEEIVYLAVQLSEGKSPRAAIFRKKLSDKGVTHPDYLSRDLGVIRNHVIYWYDADPIGTLGSLFTPQRKF
ncbi:hypothetical protein FJZ18_01100 [Candidatus Pacearchaeota archaeon]|nr:hypothetical protein [Candidatus Pacearchaeota archaeon]